MRKDDYVSLIKTIIIAISIISASIILGNCLKDGLELAGAGIGNGIGSGLRNMIF